MVQRVMLPREALLARIESEASASSKGASARTDTSASRLAPMPAKELPESSAPKEMKNLPRANKYTNRKKSACSSKMEAACITGTKAAARTVVANKTSGAKRKIAEESRGTKSSFRKSLSRSE